MDRRQLAFCSRATVGLLCAAFLLTGPSFAQTESKTTNPPRPQAEPSPPPVTNQLQAQTQAPPPLTPERCLMLVRSCEPQIPKWMEAGKNTIHALIPDPQAYEKTLPPIEKVVSDKDKLNLKNYGGLSEAYLYSGDEATCQKLYSIFASNAKPILGPDDIFSAGVEGDIGLYYFNKQDYVRAAPFMTEAIAQLESHLTPANSNNLVAAYMCMALIRDKAGDKTEAETYAKKSIDLTLKQRQPMK